MTQPRPLRALGLNCTLKGGTEAASTEVLLVEVPDALRSHGADETGVVHSPLVVTRRHPVGGPAPKKGHGATT